MREFYEVSAQTQAIDFSQISASIDNVKRILFSLKNS